MIVALTGKARSGKDTAAQCLISQGFTKLAFADALREVCVKAFGWPLEWFTNDVLKDEPVSGWPTVTPAVSLEVVAYEIALRTAGHVCESDDEELFRLIYKRAQIVLRRARTEEVTPRRILQIVGTDIVRHVWPDAWIVLWELEANKHQKVVVTDCRFPDNEAGAIRTKGGMIILLARDGAGAGSGQSHASETEIDHIKPDAVLCNDGTIQELHQMVLLAVSLFPWERRAA